MRPDARGSAMEASFKAKQTCGGECAYQTDPNVDAVVKSRGPSMARSDQRRVLASIIPRAVAISKLRAAMPRWRKV